MYFEISDQPGKLFLASLSTEQNGQESNSMACLNRKTVAARLPMATFKFNE
jgi:hypothetical protein